MTTPDLELTPGTSQKLKDITDIPNGVAIMRTDHAGDSAALRAAGPASFGTRAGTAAPFGYADKETELRAGRPLIDLSPRGRVRRVRFTLAVLKREERS